MPRCLAAAVRVLASGYETLVIPELGGYWLARKWFPRPLPVRLNAQHVEHHHKLTHVLTRMPRCPLQILVQRHVAVVDMGLVRKVGRLARATPPGPESPQHVLSVG